jgi:hypothetical protein
MTLKTKVKQALPLFSLGSKNNLQGAYTNYNCQSRGEQKTRMNEL